MWKLARIRSDRSWHYRIGAVQVSENLSSRQSVNREVALQDLEWVEEASSSKALR